ncbi:ATP-binding cassette domain-containing protein [Gammaproteobacteria bacterium]|nr:ATP-binding cassette domain-containing protein [Gammaproteobacteria bacterium]
MKNIIDIKNISLKISTINKNILFNINCEIKKNDFVILLGTNGSGKSSLLKCLDGRYTPTSGEIILNDLPLKNHFKKGIKTITQNTNDSLFTTLTIKEHFLLIKNKNDSIESFKKHLEIFNKKLIGKLNQTVEKLSGGEKQALILSLIFLHPPKILLLDEHTSALDPVSSESLMNITNNMIKKHKITCIMTTHDLSIAKKYGNRIIAMKDGTINSTINNQEKYDIKNETLKEKCY